MPPARSNHPGVAKPKGTILDRAERAKKLPYIPFSQPPSVRTVQAYEVIGLEGPQLVREKELDELIRQGRILRALYPSSDTEYYVLEEAATLQEHARNIYEFERHAATAEMLIRTSEANRNTLENLFAAVNGYALRKNSSPQNLRHLTFMLREAADAGGDLLLAAALLLHNSDLRTAGRFLKRQKLSKTDINEAIMICEISRKMNSFLYLPVRRNLENQVHDAIDSLIKISRGNWRALIMFATHKLSSLAMDRTSREDIALRSVTEIYAPLCERYG
jgi:hypothetical protein